MSAESNASLSSLLRVLWHKKLRVMFIFTLVLAGVVGVIYLFPRSYASEAKLLVRVGRESVTLDATASFGQMISIQQDRQDEINSAIEVLKSRALREQVVDILGTEFIIGNRDESPSMLGDFIRQAKSVLKNALRMPPISDREVAILSLENCVDFDTPKLTSVVSIRCSADSPETAQKIVATYCDAYLKEHVRLHQSVGALPFFQEQTDKFARELKEAEGKLRASMNEAKLLSVDGRRAVLEAQIGEIEQALLTKGRELLATESRISSINNRISSISPMIIAQSTEGFAAPASDGMRQQLYDLEIREKRLQQEYTENHPELLTIKKQLPEVRNILDQQDKDRTQVTNALNPQHQKLILELNDQQTNLAALERETAKLSEQQTALNESLKDLNDRQPELAALQRRIDVLSANYLTHSEKLEQSRVENALALDQFSNVRVFQPATLTERPASPKIGAMLMLGLVAALFAGIGSAFLGELRQFELKPLPQVGHYLADVR